MSTKRFPKRVFEAGEEPDPRFSLANERTFVAWVRTALALILAGVAIEVLKFSGNATLRLVTSCVFICLGIAAACWSWFGWVRSERALRHREPLPGVNLGPLLAILIALAGGLLIVGLIYGA